MKYPASVYPLAFSADGHKLIIGSFDQSFRVWDATPRAEPTK
jgi:WD40 repeat protein